MVAVPPGWPAATSISLFAGTGLGQGGIFATAALVYTLALLHVVKASERNLQGLESLLVLVGIPLQCTFLGLVLFESLGIIGLI